MKKDVYWVWLITSRQWYPIFDKNWQADIKQRNRVYKILPMSKAPKDAPTEEGFERVGK